MENFRLYVDQSVHDSQWDRRLYRAWTIFVLMLVAAAAASVIYFAQRIGYMLGQHGLVLTDEMNYDLVHLQIQFLASALSLNLIMALSLMAVYKYLSYREYLGALGRPHRGDGPQDVPEPLPAAPAKGRPDPGLVSLCRRGLFQVHHRTPMATPPGTRS